MATNLRYHHRIEARGNAEVETSEGLLFNGHLIDISKTGVSIACDRQVLEGLLPPSVTPHPSPRNRVPVVLHFVLAQKTQPSKPAPMATECNIIYARRTSRDIFQLGLEFHNLNAHQAHMLDHYLSTTSAG